jgi:hypothetical protein
MHDDTLDSQVKLLPCRLQTCKYLRDVYLCSNMTFKDCRRKETQKTKDLAKDRSNDRVPEACDATQILRITTPAPKIPRVVVRQEYCNDGCLTPLSVSSSYIVKTSKADVSTADFSTETDMTYD